jgi:hypothetical protein
MSEVREKLKPLLGRRVNIRGVFAKWDDHWMRNYRQTGRACIQDAEIDCEIVSRHVWVTDVPHWKQHRGAVGSQVVFDAVVQSYIDKSTQKTNYCFGNAATTIWSPDPGPTSYVLPPRLSKTSNAS